MDFHCQNERILKKELIFSWNGPMSIAIYAPGTDYLPSIKSIQYLRNCLSKSNLVRQFVTFHIYFSYEHMSDKVSHIPTDSFQSLLNNNETKYR